MVKKIHRCKSCSLILNRKRPSELCYKCSRPKKGHVVKSSFKKGIKPWNKGLKGIIGYNKDKVFSIEWRENMSKARKGKKLNYSPSEETRRKISESQKGEKANNWKGGIYSEMRLLRNRREYKSWRRSVLERDNHTCVFCGLYNKQNHADHIKPFSVFTELRFDINNGRTLCPKCHYSTDTYGGKLSHKKSTWIRSH